MRPLSLKWTRIEDSVGCQPRPRHGQRAVVINELIIIFGGGNDGIFDDLHVYNTELNQWYSPIVSGDRPPGCAAFGFVAIGHRLIVFGGMLDFCNYSNLLYELDVTTWEWRKLNAYSAGNELKPCPRLGHSFTAVGQKVFLFGGLANESKDSMEILPKYLNDLYILDVSEDRPVWHKPMTYGVSPSPRESHSAVAYSCDQSAKVSIVIYGGMSTRRLGDVWVLDTDTLMWSYPVLKGVPPLPRSLHSATLVGNRMYVFGGWTPLVGQSGRRAENLWRCTETLACLNLETMFWEDCDLNQTDKSTAKSETPTARAGHCAVAANGRVYIWSGRDGNKRSAQGHLCCKDLWFLEVNQPSAVGRITLVRAAVDSFQLRWDPMQRSDYYLLEIQKIDQPLPPPLQTNQSTCKQIVNPISAPSTHTLTPLKISPTVSASSDCVLSTYSVVEPQISASLFSNQTSELGPTSESKIPFQMVQQPSLIQISASEPIAINSASSPITVITTINSNMKSVSRQPKFIPLSTLQLVKTSQGMAYALKSVGSCKSDSPTLMSVPSTPSQTKTVSILKTMPSPCITTNVQNTSNVIKVKKIIAGPSGKPVLILANKPKQSMNASTPTSPYSTTMTSMVSVPTVSPPSGLSVPHLTLPFTTTTTISAIPPINIQPEKPIDIKPIISNVPTNRCAFSSTPTGNNEKVFKFIQKFGSGVTGNKSIAIELPVIRLQNSSSLHEDTNLSVGGTIVTVPNFDSNLSTIPASQHQVLLQPPDFDAESIRFDQFDGCADVVDENIFKDGFGFSLKFACIMKRKGCMKLKRLTGRCQCKH